MNREPVILCVEDDAPSRTIMKIIITRVCGYSKLYVFENSYDFIERVQDLPERPELFLLDIHMKPYDGFDMLKMLKNDPLFQHVPVIAVTASVMSEEVQELRSVGFNGIISKPIDQKLFPGLMERILNGEEIWKIT